MPNLIVFTDLDGSLLDGTTYSYEAATPALTALREQGIPLVLVSSKTRAEMEPLRQRLGHRDPFIVENGGAVFIPHGLFDFPLERMRTRVSLPGHRIRPSLSHAARGTETNRRCC